MDNFTDAGNFSSNYDDEELAPTYQSFDAATYYFLTIAYTLSTFLVIFLNSINIIVLPRMSGSFNENTQICLLTLSVVDFLTGVVCSSSGVIFVFVPLIESVRIPVVVLCTAFVWQSMVILTLASVDRYIAVTRPLQYVLLVSRSRVIVAIIVVVVATLVNSGGSVLHSLLSNDCHHYSGICTSSFEPSFIVYNVLPFAAIVVTTYVNIRLVLIARKHEKAMAMRAAVVNAAILEPVAAGAGTSAAGLKGLKTVLVITGAFYLAWLPSTVLNFLAISLGFRVPALVTLTLRYLIICNSWWNAAVYWLMNQSYRDTIIKLLRCRGRNRVGPSEFTRSSETNETWQA